MSAGQVSEENWNSGLWDYRVELSGARLQMSWTTDPYAARFSPTTRINYMSQWRKWEPFADDNRYPVFPADPVRLADWVTQQTTEAKKPGTIRMAGIDGH